ncbi:MAG: ribosomal protein S18-alanine N-acetyltransferase [Acidimicrobiia bacterium]
MAARGGLTTFRAMGPRDVTAVAALERLVFPEPWPIGVFRDELRQENRTYLVAEEEGELVAYAGLLQIGEEGHITTVAVEPSRRRAGLASRLLLELVETARRAGSRRLTLEVRTTNRAAQALYQKFGFAPVGMRKRYYGSEDALVMWAEDIDEPPYLERLERIRQELP